MHVLKYFLGILKFQAVYSCFPPFLLDPDDKEALHLSNVECCRQKTIGDYFYSFLGKEDTSSFGCDWDCVYTRVEEPNSRYCFKHGEDQPQCQKDSVTIYWYTGMESKYLCMSPDTKVTFQSKENIDICNADQSFRHTTPYEFMLKSTETYFACDDNGMTVSIFADNNCTCDSVNALDYQWNVGMSDVIDKLKQFMKTEPPTDWNTLNKEFFDYFIASLYFPGINEAIIQSSPCSPVRVTCEDCSNAYYDAIFQCILHKNYLDSCKQEIEDIKTICQSCFCALRNKCIPSFNCTTDKPRENAFNTETRHPCDRVCDTEPMNMKCIFNLTLESLYSDTDGRRVDGENRSVLAYNGKIPGPPIVICEGDELVVNLTNNINGDFDGSKTTTLHFHGIRENGRPWSDGVPFVSQCPILPNEYFIYGFNAHDFKGSSTGAFTQPGTYWYHSHVGAQRTDGAYGALIIRPKKIIPETRFDRDETDKLIILQEWYDSPGNKTIKSLLINGNGRVSGSTDFKTEYTVYNVEYSQMYIFRVIGAISEDVPLRLSIDDHNFTAIAADSQDIQPVENLTDLWIAGGERFHIVVQAKENTAQEMAYKIRVFGYSNPNTRTGEFCTIAWLHYPGQTIDNNYVTNSACTDFELTSPRRTLNPVPNKYSEWGKTGNIFIKDVKSLVPKPSLNFFGQSLLNTHYIEFIGATFNNLIMDYSRVPFLLQRSNNEESQCGVFCNLNVTRISNALYADTHKYISSQCVEKSKPTNCDDGKPCKCEHVLKLPNVQGYWTEIVLINNDISAPAHPIHQHGGWFWVLGMGKFPHSINRTFIMEKDKGCNNVSYFNAKPENCLHRNFDHPAAKDTIQVPPGGYVILRTPLDNKGAWLFHCHINRHVLGGMAMILKVGGPGYKKERGQDWCTGELVMDQNCTTKPLPPMDKELV